MFRRRIDQPSLVCSLSSSPGGSGRGRTNFLQRLSSTLRDRSSRGFKKEENNSSAQTRSDTLSSSSICIHIFMSRFLPDFRACGEASKHFVKTLFLSVSQVYSYGEGGASLSPGRL